MPDEPLAYFLTFRCYGTWLRGDERGYTSRGDEHGAPRRVPRPRMELAMRGGLRHAPAHLGPERRLQINAAMPGICEALGWRLLAVNARTNHVHLVVAGAAKPERMLSSLKAWTTRKLREAGLAGGDERLWSRHGSTRYLWTETEVQSACHYVLYSQDEKGEDGGVG